MHNNEKKHKSRHKKKLRSSLRGAIYGREKTDACNAPNVLSEAQTYTDIDQHWPQDVTICGGLRKARENGNKKEQQNQIRDLESRGAG